MLVSTRAKGWKSAVFCAVLTEKFLYSVWCKRRSWVNPCRGKIIENSTYPCGGGRTVWLTHAVRTQMFLFYALKWKSCVSISMQCKWKITFV